MILDLKIEQQVRDRIENYRAHGCSDEKIKEGLLKTNLDSITISNLMQNSTVQNTSKPFFKEWWFLVPAVIVSFFVFLFLIFVIFVA